MIPLREKAEGSRTEASRFYQKRNCIISGVVMGSLARGTSLSAHGVAMPPFSTDLVYRTHPNGGLVIVPREIAVHSDRIHRALTNARTWGEFRILLPPGEWEAVVRMLRDIAEFYDDDGVPIWEFGHHEFDGYNDIPAVPDGDYPPWLQKSLDDFIPLEVLTRFGKRKASARNGYFWCLPSENLPQISEVLEARGYTITSGADLRFC